MQFEFDFGEEIDPFQLTSMPAAAESLIYFFLRADERESVIGDLNERCFALYRGLASERLIVTFIENSADPYSRSSNAHWSSLV